MERGTTVPPVSLRFLVEECVDTRLRHFPVQGLNTGKYIYIYKDLPGFG